MSTHPTDFTYGDVLLNPQTGLPYSDYPQEGEEVPESFEQFDLVVYLTNLLRWLLRDQEVTVMGDLCIYRNSLDKYPLSPDVVVFPIKFTEETRPPTIESWKLYEQDRPAPLVAFEISSASTWQADLKKKPNDYQTIGVKEYFVYDPGNPPHWKDMDERRLVGWEYTRRGKKEIVPNKQGWLWSKQLSSWLVPAGYYLQFYDGTKQRRLGQVEAEIEARKAVENELEVLELELNQTRQAAENAQKEAEKALRAESLTRNQLEVLKAKLRAQGIDPDSL